MVCGECCVLCGIWCGVVWCVVWCCVVWCGVVSCGGVGVVWCVVCEAPQKLFQLFHCHAKSIKINP